MSPYMARFDMEQSRTLMTAHIHFIDDRLSLIRIPLKSYPFFVQAILQLVFPTKDGPEYVEGVERRGSDDDGGNGETDHSKADLRIPTSALPWAHKHPFLNISITPIECSIVCSKALAEDCVLPVITRLGPPSKQEGGAGASISSEDFVAISVEGEGLEAGQRVLELTGPLARAGISIFFFTTYFSDYVLVPSRSRPHLISALEERGFTFDKSSHSYVNPAGATSSTKINTPPSSRHQHRRSRSSHSSIEAAPPSSPPPTSLSELQSKTFTLLKRHNIQPQVDSSVRLVQCAGRSSMPAFLASSSSSYSNGRFSPPPPHDRNDLELQIGITKCIVRPPRYFSLTLTSEEAPSLLLDRRVLGGSCGASDLIGGEGDDGNSHPPPDPHHPAPSSFFPNPDSLLGAKDDLLVPIVLDLEPLPFEATGIVCGLASRLVGSDDFAMAPSDDEDDGIDALCASTATIDVSGPVDMRYLSTARGAAVMVEERDLEHAIRLLKESTNIA